MLYQFFGKPFWITLAGLAATFVIAIGVFHGPLAFPALVVAGVLAFALTFKRLEWGIALAFAELFANSHGHLISADLLGFPLSLRMAVFGAVMAAWFVLVVLRRVPFPAKDPRLTPFIALAAAVLVGFGIGMIQNVKGEAFADGNAYLYAAYVLPILSVRWTAETRRLLLQVFAASAMWVGVLTIGLLYVFTHFPEWVLGPVYTFIRDTRTGELTKMVGQIFRIFLQAQISSVVFWIVLSPLLWLPVLSKKEKIVLTAVLSFGTTVILMSLSRSFWVGMIAAGICFLALVFFTYRPAPVRAARAILLQGLTLPLAGLFLVLIVLFPFPYRVGSTGDLASLFSSRTTDIGDVAISSRWELLGPLLDEVKSAPLLGSGFGENVTFTTNDPRARAISPDGTWTTYALEWGWLDTWLKMGLLGLFAFGVLFITSIRGLWPLLSGDRAWLGIGLMCSLAMLYVTHVFSPYLNHPLGIGLLLFVLPFMQTKTPAEAEVEVTNESVLPTVQASTAPLTSE